MGEHQVSTSISHDERSAFIRHLLDDIRALEIMLEKGMIEDDITRIGAEQEFCLINENWRPAMNAVEILEAVNDPHFTTELARYNLEINLDPFELKGDAFSKVEHQLITLVNKAREVAGDHKTKVLLTGILPTISKSELRFECMTPNPRYWALNNMMRELRGDDFNLFLTGVDELSIKHDSVLFEACNTSFQTHLQIAPQDFVPSYNWAQAISGPILSVCTNSPLLLGRELWAETRIALFRQSIDTRSSSYALKDQQARVTFGDSWAWGSIADIYKNEVARYKIILSKEIQENSLEELEAGRVPKLKALNLHNGTIYRWNRACYGVGGGKAHVRIENRYIPAGPTVIDELANFALWVGLMKGRPQKFDDMESMMDFRDAKSNFVKAARNGRESVMKWEGQQHSARTLMLKELLPMAYRGLAKAGVDSRDADRLLGVIEERAAGTTGCQWQVNRYRHFRKTMKRDDALVALTKSMHDEQVKNQPVHTWPSEAEEPDTKKAARQVEHIMSTQLFTVGEHDLAELATQVMQWKEIHHVPVETKTGQFCGLLTWTHMKRFREKEGHHASILVSDIMCRKVHTVHPETDIQDAIALMKKYEIGCLPVVQNDHLVGIVTIPDLIPFDNDQGA